MSPLVAPRGSGTGLGLRVGAVLHALALVLLLGAPAEAQQTDTLTRRDTIVVAVPQAQSLPPLDSAAARRAREAAVADSIARDTVRAPLLSYPAPPTPRVDGELRWNRDELFATGAVTLLDLLERVPGLTGIRSGWITTPMVGAYLGDPSAIRIVLDGVEVDPLHPRAGGVHELARLPIWTLEEVAIEQGAEGLRVHLTSWRASRAVPVTRTDVFTGDDDTNLYRGFFGQRYRNGVALQLAAQQFSTSGQRFGGDGDALDVLARVGYARAGWSVDAYLQRVRRSYDPRERYQFTAGGALPGFEGRFTEAYVRAGIGTPSSGPWVQLIAASLAASESSPRPTGAVTGLPRDTADTAVSRAQYVLAGGFSLAGVRLTGASRTRVFGGRAIHTPTVEASADRGALTVSAFGELGALDEVRLQRGAAPGEDDDLPRVTRVGALVRVRPLPFLSLSAAAGQSHWSEGGEAGSPLPEITRTVRGEAAVRVGRFWLGGGAIRTDSASAAPPLVFDTLYRLTSPGGRVSAPAATASFVTARGTIYKAIKGEAWAMRWDRDSMPYRPQLQTRATLYLETRWLSRFPSGSFGLHLGATHEYRGPVLFPTAAGPTRTPHARVLSTLLEIRILDGVLSWQQRNSLNALHEYVPGFVMPGQTNLYGVRWEFFN